MSSNREMIYEISGLTFSYPGEEHEALSNVSLDLAKGEILCVLGPNGAGKTTLLNCMAGLFKANSGSIKLCGEEIDKLKEKEIANIIGFVPQLHTPSFDYLVKDFVLMGRAPQIGLFSSPTEEDEKRCMDVLKGMGIEHLASKSYLNISGGERQQLLIARAMLQEPKVILFDEPTAHLDYGKQYKVLRKIKEMAEAGYSIVITTHNPDHALLLGGSAAIVSQDGHLIQGKSEEIITEENLSLIYDTELKLIFIEEIGRTTCLTPEI